jgi:deoxyguanosine kinase
MSLKQIPYNYISIEGNIGAGKTSLVNLLSKRFGYDSLFEEFENNPFLTDFYKDIKNNAFPVEMFFLAERYKQLTGIMETNKIPRLIADYFFPKSLIFASFTLQEVEIELFKRFYNVIEQKIILPDLVIYLNRNTDYLLNSIKSRGRGYESYVKPSYLDKVTAGYLEFFKTETRFPIIIINMGNINLFNSPSLETLIDKVLTKKWPNGVQTIDL